MKQNIKATEIIYWTIHVNTFLQFIDILIIDPFELQMTIIDENLFSDSPR